MCQPPNANNPATTASGTFDALNAASEPQFAAKPTVGGLERIITPDKANAVYVAGLAFPVSDADPDYPALAIGNYGAMAVALGISVLLARRLGTENYGRLALMLMASQVLLMLSVTWSHVGFVRFSDRRRRRHRL